jgi:microcystin-dependent protein
MTNEAIQNVASNYQNGKARFTNFQVTNDLHVDNNLNVAGAVDFLPKGVIVAWHGTEVPKGWALCNGENDTPDLRGRFIRMSNETDTFEKPWGIDLVNKDLNNPWKSQTGNNLNDHKGIIFKHSVGEYGGTDHMYLDITQIPAHSHRISQLSRTGNPDGWKDGGRHYWRNSDYGPHRTDDNGKMTDNAGSSHGHNNIPPYYVLAFIMRL